MKTSVKEYLYNVFSKLVEEIPYLQVKYERDKLSSTHFIEVLPYNFYEKDPQYIEAELKIFDDFNRIYPDQDIAFVSEKSLYRVKKPSWVCEGVLFDVENRIKLDENYFDTEVQLTSLINNYQNLQKFYSESIKAKNDNLQDTLERNLIQAA
ncbi:hypothetical protein [Raineya sp.]|jgi:hypothetical protein